MKKRVKKIKAWAVVGARGNIKMESFFTKDYMKGKATLAIFRRRKADWEKDDMPNPLWGYAVGSEKVVSIEIIVPIQ